MDIVLGIDLGTTNSVASYWFNNKINYIRNMDSFIFPSNIDFKNNKISTNEKFGILSNVKRLVGNINIDFLKSINYDYKIESNKVYIYNKYKKKYYSIEELNSLILGNIIEHANKQTGKIIKNIVISVPAHFNQIQRESIKNSIDILGLNCLRILNEPTAAAISYGLNVHDDIDVLVFDMGGGTLDLCVLNIDNKLIDVIATYGDNNLGGEDITIIIANYLINKLDSSNISKSVIKENYILIRNKAEYIKKNIFDQKNISISILGVNIIINYYNIKNEIKDILNKIEIYLNKIISLSRLDINDFDYILLVGGTTNFEPIKELLINKFGIKKIVDNINPYLVVSYGCSLQGYLINNKEDKISNDITILDILPLSIGIESNNGIMDKIINKGNKIPAKKIKYFKQIKDNKFLDINIYQGESNLVKNNYLIGNVKLDKITNCNSIIKIEIEVNLNNIIKVIISEKNTNNEESIILEVNKFSTTKINRLISNYNIDKDNDLMKKKIIISYQELENFLNILKDKKNLILSKPYSIKIDNDILEIEKKIESISIYKIKSDEYKEKDDFNSLAKILNEINQKNRYLIKKYTFLKIYQ